MVRACACARVRASAPRLIEREEKRREWRGAGFFPLPHSSLLLTALSAPSTPTPTHPLTPTPNHGGRGRWRRHARPLVGQAGHVSRRGRRERESARRCPRGAGTPFDRGRGRGESERPSALGRRPRHPPHPPAMADLGLAAPPSGGVAGWRRGLGRRARPLCAPAPVFLLLFHCGAVRGVCPPRPLPPTPTAPTHPRACPRWRAPTHSHSPRVGRSQGSAEGGVREREREREHGAPMSKKRAPLPPASARALSSPPWASRARPAPARLLARPTPAPLCQPSHKYPLTLPSHLPPRPLSPPFTQPHQGREEGRVHRHPGAQEGAQPPDRGRRHQRRQLGRCPEVRRTEGEGMREGERTGRRGARERGGPSARRRKKTLTLSPPPLSLPHLTA